MATHHTCDGCDQPISKGNVFNIAIEHVSGGRTAAGDVKISRDLCGRCERQLKAHADPAKWARPETQGAPNEAL